jgi:CRP/FNR family transcriptional regulator
MIEELSFDTVRKRLAAYLLRAATSEGADSKDPVVQLPTSQEIASQIGTVRELVSRNMSQLRRRRIIRLNGKMMHVLNMNALAKEAAGLTNDSSR